jgi:hypothetical protein
MNANGFESDAAEAAHYTRFDELNRNNGFFEIVGYGEGFKKYILLRRPSRLLAKSANQMSVNVLLQMAPLAWWKENFPPRSRGHKFDRLRALDFVFRVAERVGNFDLLTKQDGD